MRPQPTLTAPNAAVIRCATLTPSDMKESCTLTGTDEHQLQANARSDIH
jgi:hypothetical protein